MKRFLILLIIILGISAYISQGIYFPKDKSSNKLETFSIAKGDGSRVVAKNLEKRGLIKQGYFFTFYVLLANKTNNLQAGEYELSPSMSIYAIVKKISSGESRERKITIIEGWDVKDIEDYLKREEIISEEEKIDPALEGYLFPDTYQLSSRDGLKEVIAKMQNNFNRRLSSELRREIALQDKTVEQIVIMASLIEREVQTLEDKKMVSGLLWKRIGASMPLQADAARETYKFLGLPKAPISNPGLESIIAAIYPTPSKYWFYLSAREDGRTIFSRTLAEHNAAIQKYLK